MNKAHLNSINENNCEYIFEDVNERDDYFF